MKKKNQTFFSALWWKEHRARTVKDQGKLEDALKTYERLSDGFDVENFTEERYHQIMDALDKVGVAARTTCDECGRLGKVAGGTTLDHLKEYPTQIQAEKKQYEEMKRQYDAAKQQHDAAKRQEAAEAEEIARHVAALEKIATELAGLRDTYEAKCKLFWEAEAEIRKRTHGVQAIYASMSPEEGRDHRSEKRQQAHQLSKDIGAALDKLYDGPLSQEISVLEEKIRKLEGDKKAHKVLLRGSIKKAPQMEPIYIETLDLLEEPHS
jgi:chromosome condensin MukBEF ATPase and DNA-binding subunit MukB